MEELTGSDSLELRRGLYIIGKVGVQIEYTIYTIEDEKAFTNPFLGRDACACRPTAGMLDVTPQPV